MTLTRKRLLGAAIVLLGVLAIRQAVRQPPAETKLPLSTFLRTLERSPEAFKTGSLQLMSTNGNQVEILGQWSKDGATFQTTGLLNPQLIDQLSRSKVGFEVLAPVTGFWQRVLGTFLPLVLLVALLLMVTRRFLRGGTALLSFRDSRAKLVNQAERKITFADIAGIEEAQVEVQEILAFLADPARFTRLGGRIPKGVLLMGPPGTGKTLLARAIAGEAGVPFFSISGSDFVEMFVGVGASRVRALFEQGKEHAPCIIFIDEIDAVGRQRGTGLGGGHDEREQTLNQLLVEMDGFESSAGVILIAATNRPDVLDPALLRPGRFDRRMLVPHPDIGGRLGILRVHTKKTPLGADVDLAVIARGTPGFVGADLSNLVNEAALLAARGDKPHLDMHDFEMARDKVLMGPERRSLVVSPQNRRVSAYHEAGHAVIGRMTTSSDPIHKVTIIPRGNALGLTQQLPTEERLNLSREAASDQIAFALGGRVAEEIVFGQITSGAADDLETATDLARRMVCEWGMSERVGPMSLSRPDHQVFLGRDLGDTRNHSDRTAAEIDGEIRRIVLENHDRARSIVLAHREQLTLVADALLEFETINGAEVDLLISGEKIHREVPQVA